MWGQFATFSSDIICWAIIRDHSRSVMLSFFVCSYTSSDAYLWWFTWYLFGLNLRPSLPNCYPLGRFTHWMFFCCLKGLTIAGFGRMSSGSLSHCMATELQITCKRPLFPSRVFSRHKKTVLEQLKLHSVPALEGVKHVKMIRNNTGT